MLHKAYGKQIRIEKFYTHSHRYGRLHMLQNRVKIATLNYGDIQSQPRMHFCPKDNRRRASPSSFQRKLHISKKKKKHLGAPPADSECPLPGTEGFLRGKSSHIMFKCVPSTPKWSRNSLRCDRFETDWEMGQCSGRFYWL